MSVKLREKTMKNGQVSFYLDIYHNKTRWYEFLDIHIPKTKLTEKDKDQKRLANEIRAKREHELLCDIHEINNRNSKIVCFIHYFEIYSSNNNVNKSVLGHLRSYNSGILPFGKLTSLWLKQFEKFLLNKGLSVNTTFGYMININGLLKRAVKDGLLKRNPFNDIPKSQRLRRQDIFRRSLTIEQLQHLVSTPCRIEKQIKQAYLFSAFTGLRWSDVNMLRWDEIIKRDNNGKIQYYIHFEQEKTEDIEYLPLSSSAANIIIEREQEMKHETASPYVFYKLADPGKKYYTHKKMKRGLTKWSKAAGIERIKFHSGRHSFATNMLENCEEGDLYTVSKLLGHKSIQSTQVYAKVRDKKKLAAVISMPDIDLSGLGKK